MKRIDLMARLNKIVKSWLLLVIPVVLIIILFAMRDKLLSWGAVGMKKLQTEEEVILLADSVRILYDYSKNTSEGYRYTFLEFGSKGCLSCQKMEEVMRKIKMEHGEKVNVKFLNLTRIESQPWAKYFGVSMIPTQVILDHKGQEIFRHTGYISAEEIGKVFE